VIGGSLSGLECARRLLLEGWEVHVFRRLHDPSRSFLDRHPIYEYCPRAIAVPDEAPRLRESVESWLSTGLVVEDHSRFGRLRGWAKGGAPSPLDFAPAAAVRRVKSSSGGFFGLLDALAASLGPPTAASVDRQEVLVTLSREGSAWVAAGLQGEALGTYSYAICAYDYFLRGTRKAALRALLESVLPTSAPVMRAVAGETDACAFALSAAVPGAAEAPFDVVLVDGVPELALAVRNDIQGHEARGLPAEETWTLVASSAWTDAVRPDAISWWDKRAVTQRMLAAFARAVGCPQGRSLRPPYHWGGFAGLTRCASAPFAHDADVGLAFVGDFFSGHGAEEALQSGASLAAHLLARSSQSSVLPRPTDWVPRQICDGAEDTGALWGRPAGTPDHSWPTVEQLATNLLPRGKRCMDRYRRRGVLEQDLAQLTAGSGTVAAGGPERKSRWRGQGSRGGKGSARRGKGFGYGSASGA